MRTKQKTTSAFAFCPREPISGMCPTSALAQAESAVCMDTLHIVLLVENKAMICGLVALEKGKSEKAAKEFPATAVDALCSSSLNAKKYDSSEQMDGECAEAQVNVVCICTEKHSSAVREVKARAQWMPLPF